MTKINSDIRYITKAKESKNPIVKSKVKLKNKFLKVRKINNPYEIWKSKDGTWEWRILKKWQIEDNKPFARWYCGVKSPYTYGNFEMGDVYVSDIKQNAIKTFEEKN